MYLIWLESIGSEQKHKIRETQNHKTKTQNKNLIPMTGTIALRQKNLFPFFSRDIKHNFCVLQLIKLWLVKAFFYGLS